MKYEIMHCEKDVYPEDRVRIVAEGDIDGEAYVSAYDFKLDRPIGEAFEYAVRVSAIAMKRAEGAKYGTS